MILVMFSACNDENNMHTETVKCQQCVVMVLTMVPKSKSNLLLPVLTFHARFVIQLLMDLLTLSVSENTFIKYNNLADFSKNVSKPWNMQVELTDGLQHTDSLFLLSDFSSCF